MTVTAPAPPNQVPILNPIRQSRTGAASRGQFGDSRNVGATRQSMYSNEGGGGGSLVAPPWINYFNDTANAAFNPVENIPDDSINSAMLNLAARGWTQTCVFTSTDTDTVSWTSGTFTAADGTAYSIGAGNTGNMAVKSYVYLNVAVSSIAYQVTTNPVVAIGDGKVFIAVCQPNAKTAVFTVFNNDFANIDANNIVANNLAVISADLGAITAGSIVLPTGGFIRSGQTAYDTGTGFYLGKDSGTPKFSIGNSAGSKLAWDGTTLSITGNISASDILGSTLRTAASPAQRVEIDSANGIRIYDSSNVLVGQFNGSTLTLAGPVITASDISGGTITGTTFMTAGSGNNRVTIDSTNGLQLIDSGNTTRLQLNSSVYAGLLVNGIRSIDTNSVFMESQSQNVQFFVDQASARASFAITGSTRGYIDDQDTSGGGNLSTSAVLRTNGSLKRVAVQQGTGPGFGYLYLV